MKTILFTLALLTPLTVLAQDWYAEDIPGYVPEEVVPVVPGVPAPPNYYGIANGAYRNGYTVIETETRKYDAFKGATGIIDPWYSEKQYRVVPNNDQGAPIAPFRMAP